MVPIHQASAHNITMAEWSEQETDNENMLTDEWFSYNARGDQTDSWESTPNSGGWYHVANNYAANGPVSTRNGYFGTGTTTPFSNSFAYSFDGEGRSNGLTDTTINKAISSARTQIPPANLTKFSFTVEIARVFPGIGELPAE